MKLLKSLCIIFGFSYLGELLNEIFNLPIPGSIIGLLLLFVALYSRIIKLESVEASALELQKNMGFLFVPLIVALMDKLEMFHTYGLQLGLVIIITTTITYLIVAKLSTWVSNNG